MIDPTTHQTVSEDFTDSTVKRKPRVLYVDDEVENLRVFKYMFREWFKIDIAPSGMEALELMDKKVFDVIISDQRMPNMTGVDLLELVARRFPNVTRMILTGYSDISAVIAAVNRGRIYFYIEKPWKEEEIRLVVANAMEALYLKEDVEDRDRKLRLSEKLTENNLRLESMVQERTAELQRSEEELKDHRDNLQDLVDAQTKNIKAIVDTAADGIITIEENDHILSFNVAAERMFGFTANEVIGQNIKMLMPEPDASAHDGDLSSYFATELGKNIVGREVVSKRRDGSMFPAHLAVSEFVISGKKRFTGILRDISVQKETEQELMRAREAAESANRAKSAFLATMSHEIRTPMNGVIGTLEVLRQASLTPYQNELVDTIDDSAVVLLTLIDDILDFSKIEAGKLEFESEPLSLASIVESVADTLHSVAIRNKVELAIFTDPHLPDWILGDSVRLRQIFNNLLSNAIKFSTREGIKGKVRLHATLGLNCVELIVVDNGIGIEPLSLEKLFTPFSQAESSTTRRFGGTGLGLVICDRLIDLMGGNITIDSTQGQGTTVTVSLPLKVDTTQPPKTPEPDLAGLTCFIVAQDAESGQDWGVYLTHAGADVKNLPDLDTVRREMLSSSTEQRVLIIDNLSHDFSLIELRESFAIQPEPGFVIIGNGNRRRPRLIADDISNIVLLDGNSPHRADLVQAVALAVGRVAQENDDQDQPVMKPNIGVTPNVDEAASEGRLILVAEDNGINQDVIRRQLAVLGYAVEIADDGNKALTLWRTGRYALLLTDLHMPEMDGYELTTAIRKHERELGEGQSQPIVALTANAMKGEELRCRKAGMNGYLSKPVPLNMLQVTLKKWLPPGKPILNRNNSQAIADAKLVDELAVLDTAVLSKLVGDDAELIDEFIDAYHQSAQNLAAEIRSALTSKNWKAVSDGAHKLKSSSRSVGAMVLGDVCSRLEKAGNDGNAEIMSSLKVEFENIFAAVIDAIIQRKR